MLSLLASGREPFPAMWRSVESLKSGQGLRNVAPFIASPLIELLAAEVDTHALDQDADGSWVTRFWKA